MENKLNLLKTLQHLDFLNKTLSEVCELADKADMVFSKRSSLKTIRELFDSSWKKLLDYEVRCSGIPSGIDMQAYDVINRAFLNVSDATIDRKTFEEILKPSSDAIDNFLNLIKEEIDQVIIATSATIAGEMTAMYIKNILQDKNVEVFRIGYGLPAGGDIEYADEVTLMKSLEGIKKF